MITRESIEAILKEYEKEIIAYLIVANDLLPDGNELPLLDDDNKYKKWW